MKQSAFGKTRDLVVFLFREGGLLQSPILLFAFAASASRTLMIFLVNETAEAGGADLAMFAALLAAVAASLLSAHWARVRGIVLVENLTRKLRRRVADHVLNADVSFFQAHDSGQIYSALTGHSVTVAGATMRLVEMVQSLLLLIFCFGYMALQSWPAVVASAVALSLGVLAFLLAESPARRVLGRANDSRTAFYDAMNDMLRGYKELRLRQARRLDLSRRTDAVIDEARDRMVEAERLFSYSQVAAAATLALLLVAIVTGLPLVAQADSVVILQVLTVVLFTFGPIEAVVGGLPGFARASVEYERMNEVLDALDRNPESEAVRQAADTRPRFDRLELRGITATLRRPSQAPGSSASDSFTMGPVDLAFTPGQSVFITGGNGMGKSTLLQILTGLRHADGGQILLNGTPVTRDSIGDYRGLFSAVFSEFYLFRRLYGLTEAERAELQRHIEELGLAGGVSIADGAFSSLALSTGQMRRLALSIALAEARPIVVLDEFAADQDPQRRAFFYDVLVPRLAAAGHLVIAVTHDEACFHKCDRLIRMEDGKVVSDRLTTPEAAPA